VYICLELFNGVSAEQTLAMRKTKFSKRVSNSRNVLCQSRRLLLKLRKN